MENYEINDRFLSHIMDHEKTVNSHHIRCAIKNLAHDMNGSCPDCREKSLAMTHLEEALMWFNKGLARAD